jgi:hypothetical protein
VGAATWTLATSVSISLDAGAAAPGPCVLPGVGGLISGVSDLIVDVRLVKLGVGVRREASSGRSLLGE